MYVCMCIVAKSQPGNALMCNVLVQFLVIIVVYHFCLAQNTVPTQQYMQHRQGMPKIIQLGRFLLEDARVWEHSPQTLMKI